MEQEYTGLIAPDLYHAKYFGWEIDVWGLGCLLYHLIFEKEPFCNNTLLQLDRFGQMF